MDEGGQHQNGRYKMEYYKATHSQWNMLPQHQVKEQTNALVMNKKIMSILAERDAAIQERNQAIAEKKEALAQRDEAIQQREQAITERDKALMERDNALAAIHYREESMSVPRGAKGVIDTAEASVKRCKESKTATPKRKVSKVEEDGNGNGNISVPSEGKKFKVEWDVKEMGLNLINFDETTMPVPVCSCTGAPRQCYKWGSGGWQSSCCTTSISCYPLPQMPNKRHARLGGRKMSGSVFTKLLSRLAAEGHDLSVALDLKEYWARHGTNRYITIK